MVLDGDWALAVRVGPQVWIMKTITHVASVSTTLAALDSSVRGIANGCASSKCSASTSPWAVFDLNLDLRTKQI
jgi:hypothetical protein